MSTLDVAQLLRVSPRQVLNMHCRGQLPRGLKIPGVGLRWTKDQLHEWLENQREAGKP